MQVTEEERLRSYFAVLRGLIPAPPEDWWHGLSCPLHYPVRSRVGSTRKGERLSVAARGGHDTPEVSQARLPLDL